MQRQELIFGDTCHACILISIPYCALLCTNLIEEYCLTHCECNNWLFVSKTHGTYTSARLCNIRKDMKLIFGETFYVRVFDNYSILWLELYKFNRRRFFGTLWKQWLTIPIKKRMRFDETNGCFLQHFDCCITTPFIYWEQNVQ